MSIDANLTRPLIDDGLTKRDARKSSAMHITTRRHYVRIQNWCFCGTPQRFRLGLRPAPYYVIVRIHGSIAAAALKLDIEVGSCERQHTKYFRVL